MRLHWESLSIHMSTVCSVIVDHNDDVRDPNSDTLAKLLVRADALSEKSALSANSLALIRIMCTFRSVVARCQLFVGDVTWLLPLCVQIIHQSN